MIKMKLYFVILVLCLGGVINNASYAGDGLPSPVKNIKRKNSASEKEGFSKNKHAHYDHTEIEKHLRAYVTSNLSIFKYAQDNNISSGTFRDWIKKYNNRGYSFKIDAAPVIKTIKYVRYEHAVIEKHLRAYVASNLSIVKYAQRNNIPSGTFRDWIKKYNGGGYTFKIDAAPVIKTIKYAHYDHTEIEKHLRAYVASNLSIVKYTRDNNIPIKTFRYWIRKYNYGEYTFTIDAAPVIRKKIKYAHNDPTEIERHLRANLASNLSVGKYAHDYNIPSNYGGYTDELDTLNDALFRELDSELSGFIFEDLSVDNIYYEYEYEYDCMSVEEFNHLLETYP